MSFYDCRLNVLLFMTKNIQHFSYTWGLMVLLCVLIFCHLEQAITKKVLHSVVDSD